MGGPAKHAMQCSAVDSAVQWQVQCSTVASLLNNAMRCSVPVSRCPSVKVPQCQSVPVSQCPTLPDLCRQLSLGLAVVGFLCPPLPPHSPRALARPSTPSPHQPVLPEGGEGGQVAHGLGQVGSWESDKNVGGWGGFPCHDWVEVVLESSSNGGANVPSSSTEPGLSRPIKLRAFGS